MSKLNSKNIKLSGSAKFVIIVAAIAVVLLIFVIVSASLSVTRAKAAIEELQAVETITFTPEVKALIDEAQSCYDGIGVKGLADSENFANAFLGNAGGDKLLAVITEAKQEYVRLAIKAAYTAHRRKYADGNTDEEIIELIQAARVAVDEYFKDNYEAVETYDNLLELEEKYDAAVEPPSASEDSNAGNSSSDQEEDIELC